MSDENCGADSLEIDTPAVAITILALALVAIVGFHAFDALSPGQRCSEYGDGWEGKWVNESQPPKGDIGIVCTAPNGTTVNKTVKDSASS